MVDIGKIDPVGVGENNAVGITGIKTVDTAETNVAGVGKICVASTVKIDVCRGQSHQPLKLEC